MWVEDGGGPKPAPPWLKEGVNAALRGYQRGWLAQSYASGGASLDVAHKGGRQIGKDHTWAFEDALDVGCRPRRQWSLLSASLSHSKDYLADVSTHLDFLRDLHRRNGVGFPRKIRDSAEMIVLENGSSIRAYAATPKNAQGRRGNVVLNELSIMPRAALIFETAEAVVRGQRTQGRDAAMRVIGNAGVRGCFFDLWWEDQEKSGSFVKITSRWEDEIFDWLVNDLGHAAEKARRWVEIQVAQIIARLGHAAFGQWYRCESRSPEEGYFDPEVLTRQSYDPDTPPADFPDLADPGVRQGVGWDPSRRRHPAGFCNCLEGRDRWDDSGNLKANRHFLHTPARFVKEPWHIQHAELDRRIRQRDTVKAVIDRQGIGDAPSEDAIMRHGGLVEARDFSPDKRMALLGHTLDAFERGILLLPIHTDMRMEFEAIQRVYNKVGREGAVIPEQVDNHGDLAVAGMLAEWGLSHPGPALFGGWA